MMKTTLALALSIAVCSVHAQILLNIDLTNPNAATITATAGASLISDSNTNNRIQLTDLFASFSGGFFGIPQPSTGNLQPALSNAGYNRFLRNESNPHLLISRSPSGFQQTFIAGQQAFTGTQVIDFSGSLSFLRTSNYVGNIHLMDNFTQNTGQVIGQYSVTAVPEPATMTALVVGAAALMRRRKRA